MGALADGLDRDLGFDQARRAALVPVLRQVHVELCDLATPGAALLDLVEEVKNPATRTAVIEGKVDLLDAVLRFVGRSLGGMSSTLCGILDNDGWHVQDALRKLNGVELLPEQQIDEDAGLTEDERIDLAMQWVVHLPAPGHHVVWLFYLHARADWRFAVGSCEFFDGQEFVGALAEVDEIRTAGGAYPGNRRDYNTPPAELIADHVCGKFLRDRREWPTEEHWVGVRVDLGTGTYPNVVETARDQVRALVTLAAFDCGQTSWTELSGYKHFIDGREVATAKPFEELGIERKWAEADHTGDWLREHQAELGNHHAVGPEAHAVVAAAAAFANTATATPAIALLEAVRVIEAQASVLQIHWKELVHEYAILASSLFRAQIAAVDAIEALAGDHALFMHLPHLRDIPSEFNKYVGSRRVVNMVAAVERLPTLVAEVPTYNLNCRRLRHVAEDLTGPATIAKFVDEATAREQRLLRRVHRVRNSLTHGGPVNNTIIESASTFISGKARHITGVTLRALLDGQPPIEALRKYRQTNASRTAGLASTPTVGATLFPGATSNG